MKVITLSAQLKLPLTVGEIEKAVWADNVFIASPKVTWIWVSIGTSVSSLAGKVAVTVGGVISGTTTST